MVEYTLSAIDIDAIIFSFVPYLTGVVIFQNTSTWSRSKKVEFWIYFAGYASIPIAGVTFGPIGAKTVVVLFLALVAVLWRSMWYWGAIAACTFATAIGWVGVAPAYRVTAIAFVFGLGAMLGYFTRDHRSHLLCRK